MYTNGVFDLYIKGIDFKSICLGFPAFVIHGYTQLLKMLHMKKS